jgi:GntR family histidine utilization transcriptional repressor
MNRARSDRSLPPYRVVKEHILGQIEDGSLKPGALVPSEHTLVAAFGYSRMTINRAIRELTAAG